MFAIVSALLRYLLSCLRPKHEIALENLALRHQIALLNRSAHKPRLRGKDRLFWVVWVAKTPCSFENLDVSTQSAEVDLAMLDVIFALLRALLSGFRPQSRLMLENLALRHQLAVLKRQTHKPKLRSAEVDLAMLDVIFALLRALLSGFRPQSRRAARARAQK